MGCFTRESDQTTADFPKMVLSLGGEFSPYFKPHWGFFYQRPTPPWGICSFSKKNDKCPGGMGTLGID